MSPRSGLVDAFSAPRSGLVDALFAPQSGHVDALFAPQSGLVDAFWGKFSTSLGTFLPFLMVKVNKTEFWTYVVVVSRPKSSI